MNTTGDFLASVTQLLMDYKVMGEKAIRQIPAEKLSYRFNEDSNSVAMLVNHLNGNMLSRWTQFLETNGEKPWRERDSEFEAVDFTEEMLWHKWEEGWHCLFRALSRLTSADLPKIVRIGDRDHSVVEAICRQLMHYASHIGQIVYLAKLFAVAPWESLSIPKGQSPSFK